jgi:hypothetical protein
LIRLLGTERGLISDRPETFLRADKSVGKWAAVTWCIGEVADYDRARLEAESRIREAQYHLFA